MDKYDFTEQTRYNVSAHERETVINNMLSTVHQLTDSELLLNITAYHMKLEIISAFMGERADCLVNERGLEFSRVVVKWDEKHLVIHQNVYRRIYKALKKEKKKRGLK